jgi:hypothetical protein
MCCVQVAWGNRESPSTSERRISDLRPISRSAGKNPLKTLSLLIGCAPDVCRISGSSILKVVLRRIWIINDKGRYDSEIAIWT